MRFDPFSVFTLSALMQLNGRDLMVNSSAQQIEGLELSKDETGVTAKILSDNITVSFDGYTALLSGKTESFPDFMSLAFLFRG